MTLFEPGSGLPTPHIRLDVPYDLIQGIRAAHALMECNEFTIQIPQDQVAKFAVLRKVFRPKFTIGDDAPLAKGLVRLEHDLPKVVVGAIVRPLLFPHAVLDECRRLWSDGRSVGFFFSGFVTDRRLATLEGWWRRWRFSSSPDWESVASLRRRRLSLLVRAISRPFRRPRTTGDLVIWNSERGRRFPVKAWDREYQELLGRSRFVLCPNGDFIWTYRFYEAAMCGAIPVVEDACPLYDGFRFYRMSDDPRELTWDPSIAEHNFALVRELLTVPPEGLAAVVKAYLATTEAQHGCLEYRHSINHHDSAVVR